ncbi:MAG TPA: DUF1761 domain-containing protein [Cyclobacteriaceae bacterium]
METAALNYWAILVAALSAFLVGGMWYSPAVFGKTWMKETASPKGGNMLKIFGLSFLLCLIAAINLAMFLGPDSNWKLVHSTDSWQVSAG